MDDWEPHIVWGGSNGLDLSTQQRCEEAVRTAVRGLSRPRGDMKVIVTQHVT